MAGNQLCRSSTCWTRSASTDVSGPASLKIECKNLLLFHSKSLSDLGMLSRYPLVDPRKVPGMRITHSVLFLSFSCSFRKKIGQIIAFQAHLWSWHIPGNPGFATDSNPSGAYLFRFNSLPLALVDIRGPRPHPPCRSKFFQFLGTFGKIVYWGPLPRGVGAPPRGNPGSYLDLQTNRL